MTQDQIRTIAASLLCASLLTCGPSPEARQFSFSLDVQHASALQCGGGADFTGIAVTLRIGGHGDCDEPVIDTTDMTFSGICEDIVVGRVRPVMLLYKLAQGLSAPVPLSYVIGYIDLTLENLPAEGEQIELDLTTAGDTSIIETPAALAALDSPGESSPNLAAARLWAAGEIAKFNENLDHDSDGCGNLAEACENALSLATGPEPCPF